MAAFTHSEHNSTLPTPTPLWPRRRNEFFAHKSSAAAVLKASVGPLAKWALSWCKLLPVAISKPASWVGLFEILLPQVQWCCQARCLNHHTLKINFPRKVKFFFFPTFHSHHTEKSNPLKLMFLNSGKLREKYLIKSTSVFLYSDMTHRNKSPVIYAKASSFK